MKTEIPLDRNADIAAALGRLLGHFGVVELQLVGLLGLLLGINQPRASLVYQSFISVNAKLLLMQQLAGDFVADGVLKEELQSLIEDVVRLNKRRNKYIHATWAAGDDFASLARMPNSRERRASEIVTAARIQKDVDAAAALSAQLLDFQARGRRDLVLYDLPPSWLLAAQEADDEE